MCDLSYYYYIYTFLNTNLIFKLFKLPPTKFII